jgi:hypothetical protein
LAAVVYGGGGRRRRRQHSRLAREIAPGPRRDAGAVARPDLVFVRVKEGLDRRQVDQPRLDGLSEALTTATDEPGQPDDQPRLKP